MSDDAWSSPKESNTGAYGRMYGLSRALLALFGIELIALILVSLLDPLLTFVFPEALTDPQGIEIVPVLVMGLAGMATLGGILLALPLWIYWHYRAGSNLVALGREDLQYTPAAHAYWWFVPFANLVYPYWTTLELYKASLPDQSKDEWILAETPSLFPIWWGCWLLGNIIQNVSTRMTFSNDFVEVATIIGVVATPFTVGALVIYMNWIWTISNNQDALNDKLSA